MQTYDEFTPPMPIRLRLLLAIDRAREDGLNHFAAALVEMLRLYEAPVANRIPFSAECQD